MDALDITYELRKRGKTQAQIAAELDVSHATVNNTIHNRTTSFAVAEHIANLLGKSVEALFPDRYKFKPRQRTKRSQVGRLNETATGEEGATGAFPPP